MEEPTPIPIRDGSLRRLAISFLLVVVVGSAAYLISKEPAPAAREDLVDISVLDLSIDPVVISDDPSDIEHYIDDVFGVRIKLPSIEGADFSGAGAFVLRPDIEIPIVVVEDPQGDIDRLITITYALLDAWSSSVFLDRSVRLELEHDNQKTVIGAPDGREVVLWRSGDDIFIAVAEQGASRLISRIK